LSCDDFAGHVRRLFLRSNLKRTVWQGCNYLSHLLAPFLLLRNESTLSGYVGARANKKAPAEAANTDAFSADLTPVTTLIPVAKASKSHLLKSAALRVRNPSSNAVPSVISAIVTPSFVAASRNTRLNSPRDTVTPPTGASAIARLVSL
jgi:hypothetical protein